MASFPRRGRVFIIFHLLLFNFCLPSKIPRKLDSVIGTETFKSLCFPFGLCFVIFTLVGGYSSVFNVANGCTLKGRLSKCGSLNMQFLVTLQYCQHYKDSEELPEWQIPGVHNQCHSI